MIRVRHSMDRLAADLREVPVEAAGTMPLIVSENVDYGRDLAKALAKAAAGPHGTHFHKRITSDMTGALEGEFGPSGSPKTEFVGVGFRHGANDDLEVAAKPVGVELADDVRKMFARLFW